LSGERVEIASLAQRGPVGDGDPAPVCHPLEGRGPPTPLRHPSLGGARQPSHSTTGGRRGGRRSSGALHPQGIPAGQTSPRLQPAGRPLHASTGTHGCTVHPCTPEPPRTVTQTQSAKCGERHCHVPWQGPVAHRAGHGAVVLRTAANGALRLSAKQPRRVGPVERPADNQPPVWLCGVPQESGEEGGVKRPPDPRHVSRWWWLCSAGRGWPLIFLAVPDRQETLGHSGATEVTGQ